MKKKDRIIILLLVTCKQNWSHAVFIFATHHWPLQIGHGQPSLFFVLASEPLQVKFYFPLDLAIEFVVNEYKLELVSKELNHLATILHVYAGGLLFMK